MRSWKTTLTGSLGFISVVLLQLSYAYDNNPLTNPDWSVIGAVVTTFIMGFFSKDYNVTGTGAK